MDDIKLYSTHCPHCRAVELMLKKKNIKYTEVYIDPNDPGAVKQMTDMGLNTAPGLVVNGKVMDYTQALSWIRGQ